MRWPRSRSPRAADGTPSNGLIAAEHLRDAGHDGPADAVLVPGLVERQFVRSTCQQLGPALVPGVEGQISRRDTP